MIVLGIDIGGTGIKGALVDTSNGELVTDRLRIPTPQPSTPKAVIEVVKELVAHFNYDGPIGMGIPGVVSKGVVRTAANIDNGWIDYPGEAKLTKAIGCPVTLLNDADVAAVAEMAFGAGRNQSGVVMIFTLGTGIGAAMFVNGRVVPNLELGHLYLKGHKYDAEVYASDRTRKKEALKWKAWADRLNEYFQYIEFLFSPNLIIIGGGVSKKHDKFLPLLKLKAPIVPAELRNEAGIVGAAMAAYQRASGF